MVPAGDSSELRRAQHGPGSGQFGVDWRPAGAVAVAVVAVQTYTLHFTGRRKGAIGIFDYFEITVQAPDPTSALLQAYDTHDHIHQVRMYDAAGVVIPRKDYGR